MQYVKTISFIALLCVASVTAQVRLQNQEQKEGLQTTDRFEGESGGNFSNVEKGFEVAQVNFATSDTSEEIGENKTPGSNTVLIVAAVGACACVGVLGVVLMKRRKGSEKKLSGDIFTIDDKNSVL
ncbi:hypothetical protein CCR75_003177 [Bremia lactucae]|uniref:Uncharacterized protein n=1 Tax=Bremia lactucae TaxID=4779 RepID=A0A976IIH3_BRELC|nr:hypothetical protein CCR75_003177 [Bremia lactucae]